MASLNDPKSALDNLNTTYFWQPIKPLDTPAQLNSDEDKLQDWRKVMTQIRENNLTH